MKVSTNGTHESGFSCLLQFAAVFAGVVLPRIAVLGGLPSTDEGIYAFFAQLAHASLAARKGLPDSGLLVLHPILVSWVYYFPVNHLILLRIVDMVCAVAAGLIFCKVLEAESRSRIAAALLSFIFLFTLTQPIFIQSGFKNSFFVAFIPLFLAIRLGQTADTRGKSCWFVAGGLVSLAILLRETLAPFAVVGVVSVLISRGLRSSVQFCIGGVVVGLSIISLMLLSRGGVSSLIASYHEANLLYESMASQVMPLFFASGRAAAAEMYGALTIGVLAIVAAGLGLESSSSRLRDFGRIVFWVVATLVPLLEPFTKIGFPYHFSVCLVGMAGFSALAWRLMTAKGLSRNKTGLAVALLTVVALFQLPKFVPLANSWQASKVNLQYWDATAWAPESVGKSNYLLAADAIAKNAAPGDSLSVSGFMFALYPLTGLLPPSDALSNLNTVAAQFGYDKTKIRDALTLCPADIVMTTTRTDWPGAGSIAAAVEETGLYRPVAVVPVNQHISYGNFGGTIYKRRDNVAIPCNRAPVPNR